MPNLNALHLESAWSFEYGLTAVAIGGQKFAISVAQEKAVNSYNEMFECTVTLSRAQAIELRDWLGAHLAASTEGAAA